MAATPFILGSAPLGSVELAIDGLRSAKGVVQVCLTTRPDKFPSCDGDPDARRASVSAARPAAEFSGLPSGGYALALIHDENVNHRLDTALGIPREGFGFSRNPPIRFGPPRFHSASFAVSGGATQQRVKMKYLL